MAMSDDCSESGTTKTPAEGQADAAREGTFLRSLAFGRLRQLDRLLAETLRRVWTLGAGPGDGRLVMDLDSTITEVYGHQRQ